MSRIARVVIIALLVAPSAIWGQQQPEPPQPQPRFRAGANLVRVDAYVTADGGVVKDLSADDFEVLEDNVPQRVESFELVQPRGRGPANTLREPNTVAEAREMARDPNARVFVLFMDIWHVQVAGSYRAQAPITRLLNTVIGQDDMVGVMTPDMSARNLTLARRTNVIESILKDNWFWGQRDQVVTQDPREGEIKDCYPDQGGTYGIAATMISRRREGRTLDALEDLIIHLEGIREDRKFVVLLSEGWLLRGPDRQLAAPLELPGGGSQIPGGPTSIGTDPSGRLRIDPNRGSGSMASCERERSQLAMEDHASEFLRLLQRANRANVSFYPVDARGMVVFDEPLDANRSGSILADGARLMARGEALRTLALNTDGFAIVGTNAIDKALDRMVADTDAYYLLGYYSTNTKLDGRFRKLTVRVKRKGADVRARPGYLAPTEAEAAAGADAIAKAAAPSPTALPPHIARALASLAPARGNLPARLQLAGAPGAIWVIGELDAATVKTAEWQQGGRARLTFEHERGAGPPLDADVVLEPGQRSFSAAPPSGSTIAPGRYVVRAVLTPAGGAVPLQISADVTVPEAGASLSPAGLARRRGPSTGLEYLPTADARYRRTERIRLEVPRAAADGDTSARLLGRDGQTVNVAIALSERVDSTSQQRLTVAELPLAALAQGEYVLEVTLAQGKKKDSATYAFRVIP